eukprot:gene12279-13426_t
MILTPLSKHKDVSPPNGLSDDDNAKKVSEVPPTPTPPTPAVASKVSKSKPIATHLAMAKLDSKTIKIGGVSLKVPVILPRLMTLAAMCGFSDVHTFSRYGFFTTMMTGNYMIIMNSAMTGDPTLSIQSMIIIICFSFGGTIVSNLIMARINDWEKSFMVIMIPFIIVCAFCAILDFYQETGLTNVYLFSIGWGTVLCWSNKSGFLTSLHTGNFLKIMEHCYKYLAGYDVGDEKQVGDIFTLVCMLFSFAIGCSFGIMIDERLPFYLQLIPVMIPSFCLITAEFTAKHLPDMYRAYILSVRNRRLNSAMSIDSRSASHEPSIDIESKAPV